MNKREQLSENLNELFEQLFERMPVHIYFKNTKFEYIACNPLQAHDAGFSSPEEIVGKTDYDFHPKSLADKIRKNDKEVLRSGKPCIFDETVATPSNENPIYLSHKTPLFNNKGETIGIAGVSLNITTHKQKEEKLEITLAGILENMPGHVYWKNKDSVFEGCNLAQAKSAGFSTPAEMVGKTDNEMPWSREATILRESDLTVMENKISITREEASRLANSDHVSTFLSKKSPLFNSKGEVIGVLGISFDITDRKQMEKELEQAKIAAEGANHAKSEFLANISHDVRTPLTGIITFSRFLKEQDKLSDAQRKEVAGDTYHASEQLLNLLNGVLEFISADSATDNDLNLKSFNLKQMIDELIQLETPAVKSHHLELRQSIDKNIPEFIVSDKMKLHRILLNLIGNSIKFTKKGYIKLSAKLQSKDKENVTVVFSVEDTGIGIPEEAQPQIFERFYKVNSSYKSKYIGNGIGLNIVQTYLQLLGGKIGLHSTFGKGTTFLVTLTFPIGKELKEDAEDSAYKKMLKQEQEEILLEEEVSEVENSVTAGSGADNINSTLKILLIEDNIFALKALRVLLRPFKLHVLEAGNAEDAFELVKKEIFDLIITDIGLPGMQGDELVAKIRQLEKEEGRIRGKIVALTGHATDGELADNCKKAGVDELFKKPMQPMLLKNLLNPFMKMSHTKKKVTPKPKLKTAPQEKPSSLKKGKLGVDLPDTEAQLFEIDHHLLLDLKVGVAVLGSEELATNILKNLNEEGIVPDLDKLKKAHAAEDWDTVRALAHKMKGGSTFGTVRLYYALLYMERYIKADHRYCVEALYAQMLRVIDETVDYLNKHL